MSDPDCKEKLSFALSPEWRAEFCRAAVERIFKAASNDPAAPGPVFEAIPAEWRAEFRRFIETGEADQPFLDFVETNEAVQSAIEIMFKETTAALEKLGELRRPSKASNPGQPESGIGKRMPDGTVYAGISPATGKPMYAMPQDAPGTYRFNNAQEYAKKLAALGHKDWRAPTKNELNVLFNNRAAIGGFNETGSNPAGWYWSSSPCYGPNAWVQRFSDGSQNLPRHFISSLRCVR